MKGHIRSSLRRNQVMSKSMLGLALAVFLLLPAIQPLGAQGLDRPQTWVDCELFDGVVTAAAFKPTSGNFDELYVTGNFLNGVPLISESGPGDTDYNGGRWHVNVLKDGVPADKYSGACSVDDLDLDDFMSVPVYFECPLLPRRGL